MLKRLLRGAIAISIFALGTAGALQTAATTKSTAPGTTKKAATARKYVTRPKGRPAAVARQGQPSSDRYKEIQQALISKGYLKGEPTGAWDQDSMDAMRRFQTDQKLDPTGKVTAKSLITLGLGPTNTPPAK
jgi:hypothetical protein